MGGLLAIITARGNRNTDLHINLEVTLEIIVFLESIRGFIPEPAGFIPGPVAATSSPHLSSTSTLSMLQRRLHISYN